MKPYALMASIPIWNMRIADRAHQPVADRAAPSTGSKSIEYSRTRSSSAKLGLEKIDYFVTK